MEPDELLNKKSIEDFDKSRKEKPAPKQDEPKPKAKEGK